MKVRQAINPLHVIYFMLIVLFLGGCGLGFNESETMQKAKSHQLQNKHNVAILEFKNVLKNNPSNKQARLLLAKSYLETGQLAVAQKELAAARKLGVRMSEMANLWAKLLLLQKKYNQIFTDVPLAIMGDRQAKDKDQLMLFHGYAYMAMGNMAKAKFLFDKCNDDNNLPLESRLALSRLAMQEKNTVLAERLVNEAIAIDNKNIEALLLKSRILLTKSSRSKAKKVLDSIIVLAKKQNRINDEFQARATLIQLSLADRNLDVAKKNALIIIKISPQNPLANYLMAAVSYQYKDYKNAKESLEKVLRVRPNDLRSIFLLGAVHYALGQYEQANQRLEYYVEKVPSNLHARKILAYIQLKLGRGADALEQLKSAPNSKDEELLAMIGSMALQNNQADDAVKYLTQAQKTNPRNTLLKIELAKAYMQKGAFDDAVNELTGITGKDALQANVMRIQAYMNKNDFASARKVVSELLKLSPNEPEAYFIAGMVEISAKNKHAAKNYFNKSLAKQANFLPALIELANIAYQDNNFEKSKQYFDKVLKKDVNNAKALFGKALIAEHEGRSDISLRLLIKAFENNPQEISPGLVLSRYYLKMKKPDKALDIINKVYTKHQNDENVVSQLAQTEFFAGNKKAAMNTAKSMIKKWPQHPAGYLELARAQIALNEKEQAIISLNKALLINPDLMIAKKALINLYMKSGNVSDAISLAKKITKDYPKSAIGDQLLGDINIENKNYVAARRAYERALLKHRSTELVNKLAMALELNGNNEQAFKTLQHWLDENPRDDNSRMQLALMLTRQGDNKNAIKQYKFMLNTEPKNIAVLNNLAVILTKIDVKAALVYAKKAYQLQKSLPEVADTYGWALYQANDVNASLPILAQAAMHSTNPSIQYHYAVALVKTGDLKKAKDLLQELGNKTFDESSEAIKLEKTLDKL